MKLSTARESCKFVLVMILGRDLQGGGRVRLLNYPYSFLFTLYSLTPLIYLSLSSFVLFVFRLISILSSLLSSPLPVFISFANPSFFQYVSPHFSSLSFLSPLSPSCPPFGHPHQATFTTLTSRFSTLFTGFPSPPFLPSPLSPHLLTQSPSFPFYLPSTLYSQPSPPLPSLLIQPPSLPSFSHTFSQPFSPPLLPSLPLKWPARRFYKETLFGDRVERYNDPSLSLSSVIVSSRPLPPLLHSPLRPST